MKTSTKTLAVALGLLVTLTQVNATVEKDPADLITRAIWETSQETTLSEADTVANIAWGNENKDYELVACAADLEEDKSIESTDPTDKVTKAIWETSQEVKLSEADTVANLAWGNENKDYELVACAADLEEDKGNPCDKITRAIWETSQETTLSEADTVANIAWGNENKDYELVACAADLEEDKSIESTDPTDKVTKAIWATSQKNATTKVDAISLKAWL